MVYGSSIAPFEAFNDALDKALYEVSLNGKTTSMIDAYSVAKIRTEGEFTGWTAPPLEEVRSYWGWDPDTANYVM